MTDVEKRLEKKYDDFFGNGYWEKQYKKHIIEFTKQCVEFELKGVLPKF